MRKCGKGTLLLMSAVMATSLFTGCGKGKSSQAKQQHRKMKFMQRSRKVISQHLTADEICAWLSYRSEK
ncbi:MAG: hypothetical protein ACLS54_06520 [Anaerostipes hadrus]